MKDYYKILNVRPTATEDEIKRSYRLLAKKYHPDINPGDKSAADKFADINEAYDTVSDAQKRAEYDKKVKEANAPKPRQEDIIARQRAQAQAAARQAAMRNNGYGTSGGFNPNMTMAQRMAAAAQAQAAAQAAAQAQAQAQQYQAQAAALEKKAYSSGYERGTKDAKAAADKEIAKLNAEVKRLNDENRKLKRDLAETESDRSDLEQELFNRDRELNQEKAKESALQKQMAALKQNAARQGPAGKSNIDTEKLLEQAQAYAAQLEQERNQAELKARAQVELQHDKRRQLQAQIDALTQQVSDLTQEVESLRAENEQWQQYANSEDFLSNAEARMQEWEKKQRADKRLAQPTLYGALGVLIWATAEEITTAYNKLEKRYSTKTDPQSAEKLQKIRDAYATLTDENKRAEYNATIGITPERMEEERKLIAENEQLQQEYRSQLEDKEFWERFDEIMFNAETGDADAQNQLGELYYYGDEIEQDYELATYWFKEAAKQKHADAMYNLGVCFINGEGTERNETTGLGFIRQAAKLGSKDAIKFTKGSK